MHKLFSRRQKGSYSHYPDSSDDEAYYSEDRRRPRARSLSRESFDLLGPARDHRPRESHFERRRAHSLDRRGHSTREYHHRSRPEPTRRTRGHDRRRRDESEPRSQRKLEHATNAAIDAAAVEAFRLRKEPGGWTEAKGTRIATAAASAAVADMMLDGHPGRHSKRTLSIGWFQTSQTTASGE